MDIMNIIKNVRPAMARQRSGAAASCLLSAKGREILEGLYENQNNNLHENCNGPHNTVINDAREQHYPNKKNKLLLYPSWFHFFLSNLNSQRNQT